MRPPDFTVGPFRERNTAVIRATLKDTADPQAVLLGSQLESATMTLYSEHGDTLIINSRDHIDIIDYVDEAGQLELTLTPDDMAIVDATARLEEALTNKGVTVMEYHRLLLEWSWYPTPQAGSPLVLAESNTEIRIIVRDVNAVPLGTP